MAVSLDARVEARAGDLQLDVDLSVGQGETVAVLGPNGSGKTTLLRALAGLLPLEAGRVTLDGQVLEDAETGHRVPPEHRPVGMVFQDYLLFPHLDVLDNVAFGARRRGLRRSDARRVAAEWLDRLGLGDRIGARPAELSGGQAQRVALARALATDPALLLLDEPLAALDVATRAEVRRDLRERLRSFRGFRLLVTHDPVDAVTMADRLVVLEGGRVVQAGTAADITARPRTGYVAELAGTNLYRGRGTGDRVELAGGDQLVVPGGAVGEVFATVHPRAVALHRRAPEGSPRNVWQGRVVMLDRLADRVRVRVDGPVPIVAEVTVPAVAELGLGEGVDVWVAVKASEIATYPA